MTRWNDVATAVKRHENQCQLLSQRSQAQLGCGVSCLQKLQKRKMLELVLVRVVTIKIGHKLRSYTSVCLSFMTTTPATRAKVEVRKDNNVSVFGIAMKPVMVSQLITVESVPTHPPINRIQAVIVAKALNICGIC